RALGKENEPAGTMLIGNPLSHVARSQDAALQSICEREDSDVRLKYKRSLPPKLGGRLLKKKNPGVIVRVTQQVFPSCQPAIPLSQQELLLQRDPYQWWQARWLEPELPQEGQFRFFFQKPREARHRPECRCISS